MWQEDYNMAKLDLKPGETMIGSGQMSLYSQRS